MKNPSIGQLQNPEKFELISEVNHSNIKEFVLEQISKGGKIIQWYMIYQIVMIIIGIFFFTRPLVLAFQNNFPPLIYALAALVFCFSILIVIHELLHGIAIKSTGAPKVNYGAYFKKFVFYAEADRYVINKKQFSLIALTPLVVVQVISILTLPFVWNHPSLYFVMSVMSAHSLFCAGDIALLSIFYKEKKAEIYTFDVKSEKKSYYYKKKLS